MHWHIILIILWPVVQQKDTVKLVHLPLLKQRQPWEQPSAPLPAVAPELPTPNPTYQVGT